MLRIWLCCPESKTSSFYSNHTSNSSEVYVFWWCLWFKQTYVICWKKPSLLINLTDYQKINLGAVALHVSATVWSFVGIHGNHAIPTTLHSLSEQGGEISALNTLLTSVMAGIVGCKIQHLIQVWMRNGLERLAHDDLWKQAKFNYANTCASSQGLSCHIAQCLLAWDGRAAVPVSKPGLHVNFALFNSHP